MVATAAGAWLAGVPAAARLTRLSAWKGLLCAAAAVPSAFFGARALNLLLHPDLPFTWQSLTDLNFHSFTLYGGLFAGSAALLALARLLRLPLRGFFDAASPVAGLCIGLCRVGCLLNGCCFGLPSRLPWSITPPYGGAAHAFQLKAGMVGTLFGFPLPPLPIHPTQAYEIAAALMAAAAALVLLLKKAPHGVPLCTFGLALSALRFIIFFCRAFPGETQAALFVQGPLTFCVSSAFFGALLAWSLARANRRLDYLWNASYNSYKT